jgi:hypothetical protein
MQFLAQLLRKFKGFVDNEDAALILFYVHFNEFSLFCWEYTSKNKCTNASQQRPSKDCQKMQPLCMTPGGRNPIIFCHSGAAL